MHTDGLKCVKITHPTVEIAATSWGEGLDATGERPTESFHFLNRGKHRYVYYEILYVSFLFPKYLINF